MLGAICFCVRDCRDGEAVAVGNGARLARNPYEHDNESAREKPDPPKAGNAPITQGIPYILPSIFWTSWRYVAFSSV